MTIRGLSKSENEALHLLVELTLAEDIGTGDLTSGALIEDGTLARASITAKEEGILAGLPAARIVFQRVDPSLTFEPDAKDGDPVRPGMELARVTGNAKAILAGERASLNFLQHLSGVASWTRRFVDAVSGTKAKIYDTRKTTPGFRLLEKYAVRAGGGQNHRIGLYHEVLIKENHLEACGLQVGDAVRRARERVPSSTTVEVEVESLGQFEDALKAGPDVIMLDDMGEDEIRKAVKLRGAGGVPEIEVSGGMSLETVRAMAVLGVDRISVGALTHSAPALDLSMSFEMNH